MSSRVLVEVFICVSERRRMKPAEISQHVFSLLECEETIQAGDLQVPVALEGQVESIKLQVSEPTPCWKASFELHQYSQNQDISSEQLEDEDATPAFHQFDQPHVSFENLWETLHFDSHLKLDLQGYAATSLLFSSKGVDPSVISCNRMILLYGPAGTGKTTQCKAQAQRLSIRLQKRFPRSVFVEINAHSLFSKWFSESGKQIQRQFSFLEDLVADEGSLVSILIDEVESLALSRAGAIASNEPADSVRAVNAQLTQLDKLSRKPNVLLQTTTNLTGALDSAFLDRADIRRYVGPPGVLGRYTILRSCVLEQQQKGVLAPSELPSYDTLQTSLQNIHVQVNLMVCGLEPQPRKLPLVQLIDLFDALTSQEKPEHAVLLLWTLIFALEELRNRSTMTHTLVISDQHAVQFKDAVLLLTAALLATGMSGRSLRKLPFQAYAYGDAGVSADHKPIRLTARALLEPEHLAELHTLADIQRLDTQTTHSLLDQNDYLLMLALHHNVPFTAYLHTGRLLRMEPTGRIDVDPAFQLPRPRPFDHNAQSQVSTEAFLNTLRFSVNQRTSM